MDVNVDGLSNDDLAWADLVFIGAMAVQRDSANQIITRCKAAGLKVVAGGPLFTAEGYARHLFFEPGGQLSFETIRYLSQTDKDLS